MKKKVNKKKELKQNIIWGVAILLVVALIVYLCIGYYKKATHEVKNPIATIEVENYGTMKVELYPDQAENTVNNFITLANNGFYDGLTFHRIIKDFMIQGGGTGTPTLSYIDTTIERGSEQDKEYNINGEFMQNEYNNTLKLGKGVIAMARESYSNFTSYYPSLLKEEYNTAGSQFFIMTTDDNLSITGSYAGFGKVIDGYDVLEKISEAEVTTTEQSSEKSLPLNPPVISSIRVETFDTKYHKPVTHEPFDINSFFSSMYGVQ